MKIKAKVTFTLDQILKFGHGLTVLFWKKLHLNFGQSFASCKDGEKIKVLELGPHGVNKTLVQSKRLHYRAGAHRGGCHFWSLGCKSSCPYPHPTPWHNVHVNPLSNHFLHPKQKAHIFVSEVPTTGNDSGHRMCRCAACVCTCVPYVLVSCSCHYLWL